MHNSNSNSLYSSIFFSSSSSSHSRRFFSSVSMPLLGMLCFILSSLTVCHASSATADDFLQPAQQQAQLCARFPGLEVCQPSDEVPHGGMAKRKSAYMRFGRAAANEANEAAEVEKRKSAYMRFGKRSPATDEGADELYHQQQQIWGYPNELMMMMMDNMQQQQQQQQQQPQQQQQQMEKRKSAYMRFGKRKSAYMRFGRK